MLKMNKEGVATELDVILKKLGPFGKFNIVTYALLLFPVFSAGMFGSVFIFEAPDINYRCQIKECEALNYTSWLTYAIPLDKGEMSKCKRYGPQTNASNADICGADAFDTAVKLDCDAIVYSDEDSAVKDFDLGCQNWKRTLLGTIHNSGMFVSLPLTGIMSDRFGRKKALAVASLMHGIFGFMRSFSVSYLMMLVLEFLEPALGAGAYTTAFVLAIELVGPKGRVLGNTLMNFVYILGLMSLACMAWWLQDWRKQLRIMYIPAMLVFSYIWLLDESVRWLLSKGRTREAIKILKKAAKMNNVDITKELNPLYNLEVRNSDKETIKEDQENTNKDDTENNEMISIFKKVLKSRIIRTRVCVCSFLWITCAFVYYGLSINSVSLGGNKYVNFILVAFVEIPANFVCFLVLDKFGRKKIMIVTYILSACLFFSLLFLPKDQKWLALILYLSGKFSITVAYSSVYIYVSEVFPTSVRQSLLAICSSFGRVGSTLAPLTPLLALYYYNLPSIFFGTLALIASGMVLFLPETLNMPLPDTIEEAEQLTRRKNNDDY